MKTNKSGFAGGLALTLVVFALLFSAALMLIDHIGRASDQAQTELVQAAAYNAAATCYAVEGAYPMDIEYLRENYGLAYDENRYMIHYDAFASNVMPEIRVGVKGADEP